MNAALHILRPGLQTTIQDLGRPGYQRFGIGVSGALDPVSLSAANALVGNPLGMGALEAVYVGPTFAVEADGARVAFVGARTKMEVLPHARAINGQPLVHLRSIRLRRGDVVRIGSLSGGAVLYIAVEGGFDIKPVLGSVSTDTRGRFGGWHGRALIAGDRLPLCRMQPSDRDDFRLETLDLRPPRRFRVLLGPQHDYFQASSVKTLFEREFIVSADSDRIGMRLNGPPIVQSGGSSFASDGTVTGSIQVTGSGQPIVLLPDRQTTGGYPKIATIISADLPALGRLSIGTKIGFEPVTMETAVSLRRETLAAINGICNQLITVPNTKLDLSALLPECNLISGVIDGRIGMADGS